MTMSIAHVCGTRRIAVPLSLSFSTHQSFVEPYLTRPHHRICITRLLNGQNYNTKVSYLSSKPTPGNQFVSTEISDHPKNPSAATNSTTTGTTTESTSVPPTSTSQTSSGSQISSSKLTSKTFSALDPPNLEKRGDPEKLLWLLKTNFADPSSIDQIVTNPGSLAAYGKDESFHTYKPKPPSIGFCPKSTQDVVKAVKLARESYCSVVPWGVGTSLEGHVANLASGLTLDMGKYMNKILEINSADMDVLVEPGVTRNQLNRELKDTGLFFPIDPGADATIGGMVSTRASGTNAVRYGTMKQNVLGLECVLSNGSIIKTGGRAKKSSAGYDLTSLFVGSEGTLGVITKIRLKLYGIPEVVKTLTCAFETIEQAVNVVVSGLQYNVKIARAELLDASTILAVNRYYSQQGQSQSQSPGQSGNGAVAGDNGSKSSLSLIEKPTLFLEFHGSEGGVNDEVEVMKRLITENKGFDVKFAENEDERAKLWRARHTAYYAVMSMRPGSKGWPTDVCVPISSLAECITATQKDIEENGITGPIFGHIGDGNFHVILMYDQEKDTEEYFRKMSEFNDRLVRRSLQMNGTCTGEHGIGYGKSKWMVEEHGENGVAVMRAIKQALDPDNMFNPGKILPIQTSGKS